MSRETEFLGRHKDDLKRAAEVCRSLQRNAIEMSPREVLYLELMKICKRLEGSCRQMAHERGDNPAWLQLGMHYHKMAVMGRRLRRSLNWMAFADLAKVFEAGIPRIDRMATAATGLTSMNENPIMLPAFLTERKSPGGIILP